MDGRLTMLAGVAAAAGDSLTRAFDWKTLLVTIGAAVLSAALQWLTGLARKE